MGDTYHLADREGDLGRAIVANDVEGARRALAIPYNQQTYDWALAWAAEEGYSELAKLLLEDGRADPASGDNYPLMACVMSNNLEIAKMLFELPIARGVNPTARNNRIFIEVVNHGLGEFLWMFLNLPPERGLDPSVLLPTIRRWGTPHTWRIQIVTILIQDPRFLSALSEDDRQNNIIASAFERLENWKHRREQMISVAQMLRQEDLPYIAGQTIMVVNFEPVTAKEAKMVHKAMIVPKLETSSSEKKGKITGDEDMEVLTIELRKEFVDERKRYYTFYFSFPGCLQDYFEVEEDGYFEVALKKSNFFDKDGTFFLDRFGTLPPELRGKGLGTAIMNWTKDKARALGGKGIRVFSLDEAVPFYKSQGFALREGTENDLMFVLL